jgi:Protein of unknown function (DUF998)
VLASSAWWPLSVDVGTIICEHCSHDANVVRNHRNLGQNATTTLSAAPSYLRTTRTLLTAGVWVAAFFIPADLLDALARPHYNPLRHWISHLSLGQFGWLGSVVLLLTAALLAVYAAGLVRLRRDSGGPVRYPVW